LISGATFEVFTAVKIQVEFFWIVTPCSAVVGYLSVCFIPSPVTSPWRWMQHGPLKHLYLTTTLHDVTTQKIGYSIFYF